ncbi:MAG TPA: hypothetical protein VL307_19855, partial [Chitinophagaceae bacterium]|nr:hypothetical protein [Chitinophagaceae bacterium]
MRGSIKEIRKKRCYAIEFKRELVRLFEQGKFSVLQLNKLYGVSSQLIYLWVYKYSQFNEKGYRIIE